MTKLLIAIRTLALGLFVTTMLPAMMSAQPEVAFDGVLNAASDAFVSFPNSAIAQGSIFSIYGTNLGPSSSPAQAYPLQTALGGVSVTVSSGDMTLNAIPIFVSANLINAILPGNTPTGTANLTVTFNGQTSNAASFQVAISSFGVFTASSNGTGAGIITGSNHQLYSLNSPANPDGEVTIWGTGLGASPGDDGSGPPQQIDMPTLPLTVYVGTQAAKVLYRGRSGFTGEDQINFIVPPGITGCYVPIAVEIGSVVSNFVTLPIAPAGQPCPDQAMLLTTANTGNITLARNILIGSTTSTTDRAQAFFGEPQILAFPYVSPLFGNPYSLPVGTCAGGITFPAFFDVLAGVLDAGPITIAGPNGSRQLTALAYNSELGGGSDASPAPLYLTAGDYTVSGTGGTQTIPEANVGPFSQTFTIPQPLAWTNQSISSVSRSGSLEVTWTGGDPNGTVQIAGEVVSVDAFDRLVIFVCNARASDGHFTVPAFVLLSVPPAPLSGAFWLSSTVTTPFSASGISSGTITSIVTIGKNVTYE